MKEDIEAAFAKWKITPGAGAVFAPTMYDWAHSIFVAGWESRENGSENPIDSYLDWAENKELGMIGDNFGYGAFYGGWEACFHFQRKENDNDQENKKD